MMDVLKQLKWIATDPCWIYADIVVTPSTKAKEPSDWVLSETKST